MNGNKWYFQMKKKFNLDGQDRLKQYWHDLKSKTKQWFNRNVGRESIIVWEASLDTILYHKPLKNRIDKN